MLPNNQKSRARRIWIFSLILIGLGLLLASIYRAASTPTSTSPSPPTIATTAPPAALEFKTYTLPYGIIYTLLIPAQSPFLVIPAVSPQTELLNQFAQQHQAIAVINGGFFDPENQQSTSYVVLQGKQVADPKQNDRLMHNPNLTPYLSKILDRSELRRYQCGSRSRYDITTHSDPIPTNCQLIDSLGGGPQLLPEATFTKEAFLDEINGKIVRDSLGVSNPNARTAIGITHNGSILLVMVAQQPGITNSGLSLIGLTAFLQGLGVEKAMNLDGGSSASIYYQGKTIYGKRDQAGNSIKRPVKSVLLVQEILQSQPSN